jgi:hypothetical protein
VIQAKQRVPPRLVRVRRCTTRDNPPITSVNRPNVLGTTAAR